MELGDDARSSRTRRLRVIFNLGDSSNYTTVYSIKIDRSYTTLSVIIGDVLYPLSFCHFSRREDALRFKRHFIIHERSRA